MGNLKCGVKLLSK